MVRLALAVVLALVLAAAAAAGDLRLPLGLTTVAGSTQSASEPLTLHRYEVLNTTGVGGLAGMLAG